MKLTDILKDIKARERSQYSYIEIHSDGSGGVKIDMTDNDLFVFTTQNEELPQAILTAYRNHYKIDNETLTL